MRRVLVAPGLISPNDARSPCRLVTLDRVWAITRYAVPGPRLVIATTSVPRAPAWSGEEATTQVEPAGEAAAALSAAPVCLSVRRGVQGDASDTMLNREPAGASANYGSLALLSAGSPGGAARQVLVRWDLGAIPQNAQLLSALASQAASTTLIRFFVLVTVAISIASVLVVSVVERRGQIGILRAVGTTRRSVMAIFLVQGAAMGLFGSILGCGLGAVFALVFQAGIPLQSGPSNFAGEWVGESNAVLGALKIKALGPEAADTPKARAERLRLWTAISVLCIQRLGDVETGATAYEVTLALDGQNIDRRRQMAVIYTEMGGDRIDKAFAEHHYILARNKAELGSYRALKDLYIRSLQREKAAAVAYALHLLGKDDPVDQPLIEELKARPLRPATRPLNKQLWRLLAHPEEDTRLDALFQTLREVAMASHSRSFRELGLNRKERVDMAANTFYAKALRYGFEVLDAPMPEVYSQPDDPELADRPYRIVVGMDKEAQAKGGSAAGPVTCVLLGRPLLAPKRPEREVTYEVGRLAALLRPERMLRNVYSTPAQLGLIIDAALALGGGEKGASSKVIETAEGLRRALLPAALEQVRRLGATLRESGLQGQGESAATAWLSYSDLSAVRAGLVLAGDLETVALLLATDPPGVTPLSPKQRLLDTIHFTVTEEYFTIRQHLGLMM